MLGVFNRVGCRSHFALDSEQLWNKVFWTIFVRNAWKFELRRILNTNNNFDSLIFSPVCICKFATLIRSDSNVKDECKQWLTTCDRFKEQDRCFNHWKGGNKGSSSLRGFCVLSSEDCQSHPSQYSRSKRLNYS